MNSRRRARLVQVAKVLVALALVAFVLSRVDLTDRYIVRRQGSAADPARLIRVQPGRILGPWRAERVRFLPDGADAPLLVTPGPKNDGTYHEIRPGLPTYLRRMHWPTFLLGAAFFFLVASFSSLRWWWLLKVNGLGVRWRDAFRLTWIGIFFNNIVPGLTGGDLVKAFYVARLTGQTARPVLTVLVDRVLGLVALALLAAVAVLFRWRDFAPVGSWIWLTLALLLAGSSLFLSRRLRRTLRIDRILNRLPGAALLRRIDEVIHSYRDHLPGLVGWLFLSILNHVGSVVGVALIADALGMGVPWSTHLILVPVINIVSAVPMAPSGWGVGEFLYQELYGRFCAEYLSGALDPVRAMGTRAIALSVVYRIHLMAWSLLGALFLVLQKGRASREEMSHLIESLEEEPA